MLSKLKVNKINKREMNIFIILTQNLEKQIDKFSEKNEINNKNNKNKLDRTNF
jgi:hypothetical protein